MNDPHLALRLDVETFYDWVATRPRTERWELWQGRPVGGELQAMGGGRTDHAVAVGELHRQLANTLGRRGPCRVYFGDLLSLRIDDATSVGPDLYVRCGPPTGPEPRESRDPRLVIEVLSPSTMRHDVTTKRLWYLGLPSLETLVTVDLFNRLVMIERRVEGGLTRTEGASAGIVTLAAEPPIALDLDALWEAVDAA